MSPYKEPMLLINLVFPDVFHLKVWYSWARLEVQKFYRTQKLPEPFLMQSIEAQKKKSLLAAEYSAASKTEGKSIVRMKRLPKGFPTDTAVVGQTILPRVQDPLASCHDQNFAHHI